jgi:pyruvate dehydrogenase E1 component alpha subunit
VSVATSDAPSLPQIQQRRPRKVPAARADDAATRGSTEEGVPVSDNAVASTGSTAGTSPAEDEVLAELTAPVPEVGDGGPEMIQLLTPEGQRVENSEYDEYVKDLTDEDLRGFYRDLVLIRRVDAEATALQRQGELGIWASLLGQ